MMIYTVTVKAKYPKGYNIITTDIEADTKQELNDLIGSIVLDRIPDVKRAIKIKIKVKPKKS